MSKIVLKSPTYRIHEIKKKTRAQVFSEFKEGDLIYFETTLRNTTGASGGGSYASYVRTVNITRMLSVGKSQSELVNLLNYNFELSEEDNE